MFGDKQTINMMKCIVDRLYLPMGYNQICFQLYVGVGEICPLPLSSSSSFPQAASNQGNDRVIAFTAQQAISPHADQTERPACRVPSYIGAWLSRY